MISDILLVVGVGVLSAALRSYRHPVFFRLGTLGLVATSFLAGWLLGESVWIGAAFVAMWFLLPWVEILTRVRAMRLPLERRLEPVAPPNCERFPMLGELNDEMDEEGFEYARDVEWHYGETRQFFRILVHPERHVTGIICLAEQAGMAFYYVAFRSRAADGRSFLTWNYPFSYSLELPPSFHVRRIGGELSVPALLEAHAELLRTAGDTAWIAPVAETATDDVERELREQFDHNLASGLLQKDGPDLIRYSPRGLFYLWCQFLRDFVRIS